MADAANPNDQATPPPYNRTVLLWASFLTLIAAGMGFAIRGAILSDWEGQFGFSKTELGGITGGGLVGFGVIIIISSLFVDRIGYKPILLLAFVLHVLSGVLTVGATAIYDMHGKDATYWCLYVGMFMFAIANGLCEAVINPLVAQLYPKDKTHYLNVLHAGWPGGLIVGAVLAFLFCGNSAIVTHLRWEIPILFFLFPAAMYGIMALRAKFPTSDVVKAGVTLGSMLKGFMAPLLLFLLVLHAMVGFVELGTDSWIMDIMKSVISGYAVLLFIYTSAIMFVLRFFAGPIVERINPIGLLLCSAILATVGLAWLGTAGTVGWMILAAATIYGVGKTFFWPTMLGVVGERFPKGGAITMGTAGGIGMLSAGLLGGPGIGYMQDVAGAQKLKELNGGVYEQNISDKQTSFLFFPATDALDGKKVGEVKKLKAADGLDSLSPEQTKVFNASMYGGQRALLWTAAVPAAMAIGYLILLIYFRSIGGYKPQHIGDEYYTGGVEGPVE